VLVSNPGGLVSSSPASLTITAPDTDGDGMPDYWEIAHGLNPLVDDANLDPDHDGMSNLAEYRSGTDPQDPLSVFRLEISGTAANGVRLQFQAMASRSYSVESSTDLSNWTQLTNYPPAATNRTVNVPINPADHQRYYRAQGSP